MHNLITLYSQNHSKLEIMHESFRGLIYKISMASICEVWLPEMRLVAAVLLNADGLDVLDENNETVSSQLSKQVDTVFS